MDDKKVFSKLLAALLVGLISVVGTLLLLSYEANARPVIQETDADIVIAQATSPDSVVAGEVLTYTLTVTNNGPSGATGIQVTDTLPSGVTFVSDTPSQGTYDSATGVWTVYDLANGGTAILTLTVTVAPLTRGTITNSAQVSANETDTQPGNNFVETPTWVNAMVDLAVTKTDDPDPVIAGAALTYTLTVTNDGPSDATSVQVTDTLPSGVSFVSATPSQGRPCSKADNTVICALDVLNDGYNAQVTVVVIPTVSGTITNTAKVSASEPDDISNNNTCTTTTTVNPGADLAVTKSDTPDPVIAGTTLTYTLTVINNGPSDATGVRVTDTLPSGVAFVSDTPGQGTYDSGTGVWTVDSLTNNDTATLTLAVTVAPLTRGTITNSAQVSANEPDIQPANNIVEEHTLVNVRADLAVNKTDNPDPVIAGTALTYTLTITNNGPSDATGVRVTDTLPSGVTFGSATPSQGNYNSGTGVWTVDNLTHTHIAILTIRVNVRSSTTGMLPNYAMASGNEDDPVPGNNTTTQNTQVNTQANLTITKSSPATVNAGASMTYTIAITNGGPSDATSVVITDTLDPNLDYASASPTPTGFSNGGDPYWSLAPLGPNHSNQIALRVQVHTPLTNNTVLTNTAWLDADQIAPLPATRTTTVRSSPVLTITKTDNPDPVNAGEILYYTIAITNSGNENASVTVVENYDPRVSFVYADPNPDDDSGNRVWTFFDPLTTSDPQRINVVVRVTNTLPVGTVLTNRVTLDSDQTTPITATETTSVTSASDLTISKIDVPDPVEAGEDILYFINYGNYGNASATAVVITETYDSRVTFVSANPAPRVGTNNVWDIPDLDVDKSDSIVVRVRVITPLSNGTILTNRVTIDSAHTSPKTITETTHVSSAPHLAFVVTDYPDPVAAGAPLTYTLHYTNTGNANATQPVVTATFDSRVSFSSATPPPSGGSGQVRYWNIPTIAGEGGHGQIVIRTNVTRPLTNGTQLQFEAQLGYAEGDLVPATARTKVTSAPVLLFSQSDGVYAVQAGDLLTYTLIYTNTGNENALNVTITNTLPNYVTYVGCEIPNGDCHTVPPFEPDQVIFNVPIITQTVRQARLIVRVNDPLPAGASSVINHARMMHPSLPVPIDVQDFDDISTRPDLSIAVSHVPTILAPGYLMTYTVTYSNAGQHMDANGVVITTTIPIGTIYTGSRWGSSDGRTYTYMVGDLSAASPDQTVVFTVMYPEQPVCAPVGTPEFSTAFTIAGNGGPNWDIDPTSNIADGSIGVPDLVVVDLADYTIEPFPPKPNTTVSATFTIVLKNQGTGVARNASPTGEGFCVDVFMAPVTSCPFEYYSAIYKCVGPIAPHTTYTFSFTSTFLTPITTALSAFYVKADNFMAPVYGLVPESDESNNVAGPFYIWFYHVYLPLTLKNQP